MEKDAFRKTILLQLQGTDSSLLAERSFFACRHVMESHAFQKANTILCYAALPREADPAKLAEAAVALNKRVAYPYCTSGTNLLALIPAKENGWETGAYGIRTPKRDTASFLPPEEIDLVIVPGLAFDLQGSRLGRGKGYYDRYLADIKAYTIGFAFEMQLLYRIPTEFHDARMRAVATEIGIRYIEDV